MSYDSRSWSQDLESLTFLSSDLNEIWRQTVLLASDVTFEIFHHAISERDIFCIDRCPYMTLKGGNSSIFKNRVRGVDRQSHRELICVCCSYVFTQRNRSQQVGMQWL